LTVCRRQKERVWTKKVWGFYWSGRIWWLC